MINPAVSVVCNTYNHGKYIRDALDGFIMQKTNFEFDVLIHDDVSNDNTVELIKEYETKHPNIIKPMYDTVNQYSTGNLFNINSKRVKSKYVAICEGDDYWINPHKLQMQFDIMEAHPEVDICSHSGYVVDARSRKYITMVRPKDCNCIIPTDDVIKGDGGYVVTSSLFLRSDVYKNPRAFRKIKSFDYTLQIDGSIRGGMLYIDTPLSTYRKWSDGSWSETMRNNRQRMVKHREQVIEAFYTLNTETNFLYNDTIIYCIERMKYNNYLDARKFKKVLQSSYFKKLNPIQKCQTFKSIVGRIIRYR